MVDVIGGVDEGVTAGVGDCDSGLGLRLAGWVVAVGDAFPSWGVGGLH